MPQIFRPYADTVARATLLAIVVMPLLGTGVAYWVMRSEYITDRRRVSAAPWRGRKLSAVLTNYS